MQLTLSIMIFVFFILFICFALAEQLPIQNAPNNIMQTYIVHVDEPPSSIGISSAEEISSNLINWYTSFLPPTMAREDDSLNRFVHTYHTVATGFAAKLTAEEVKEMENKNGFIFASPARSFSLHTTHSPSFLGLQENLGLWKSSNHGKGVIIGVLDTGVTPGHPSFNDDNMPPPPKKWKGKCEFGGAVCNNKLIGARTFAAETEGPPVDVEGHGTHTSSTAGGNFVHEANVFGMANGTASGIAPLAHLAIYKVCGEKGCMDSDILAAMDAAVYDGVDVLSLSLGGTPVDFYGDGIAVGAFTATQKGVFVSCSAGNSGPVMSSMENEAPWVLTVGASTTNRKMKASIVLGNEQHFAGESVFQPKNLNSANTFFPLVFPGTSGSGNKSFCGPDSMDNFDVKGKVVLCVRGGDVGRAAKGKVVKNAGGVGMILMNDQLDANSIIADAHVLPASEVGYSDGQKIIAYIHSTPNPMARIEFNGTQILNRAMSTPAVASFSSRGPGIITPGILKPDIVGPGVSILAAWPESVDNYTNEKGTFNIISGTSMSCPHLSGIAALLKGAHPTWSPAAIKSAIMTTASVETFVGKHFVDERGINADIFALGAGHVNPTRANDPGLVYDIKSEDYIPYLCGLNYTNKQIKVLVKVEVDCSKVKSISEAQLNYPSFSVELGGASQTYTRTVTNVGGANSSYTCHIENEVPELDIAVKPSSFLFSEVNQKMTFEIVFHKKGKAVKGTYVEAAIEWDSTMHSVRSPISIKFV